MGLGDIIFAVCFLGLFIATLVSVCKPHVRQQTANGFLLVFSLFQFLASIFGIALGFVQNGTPLRIVYAFFVWQAQCALIIALYKNINQFQKIGNIHTGHRIFTTLAYVFLSVASAFFLGVIVCYGLMYGFRDGDNGSAIMTVSWTAVGLALTAQIIVLIFSVLFVAPLIKTNIVTKAQGKSNGMHGTIALLLCAWAAIVLSILYNVIATIYTSFGHPTFEQRSDLNIAGYVLSLAMQFIAGMLMLCTYFTSKPLASVNIVRAPVYLNMPASRSERSFEKA